jgi:hypothetical protein
MIETLVLASFLLLDPPATDAPSGGAKGGQKDAQKDAQKDGDILRGPEVPADSLKAEKDRKKADAAAADKQSRPMLEQRVLFAALDGLKLDDAKRAQIKTMRAEFESAVADWMQKSDVKRKELFDKRKNTPTGKPVSDDFKKGMEEIEAARPKLNDLKAKISKILSIEELEQLRVAYNDGLKRAREELTKRTEAERAKQAEELKKKAEEMGKDAAKEGSKDAGGEMGDDKKAPAAPKA